MATSPENKRFLPIVDDSADPIDIELYSQADVDFIPLATLYTRTCEKLKVDPNPQVLAQLPATARHHYRLAVLDCSKTYLGNVGVAALVPVVAACIRMTHLLLPRVGMKSSGALALVKVIAAHPGLTSVNLAHNDLGTTVGKKLLDLVIVHRRIAELNLDETLIIQPIKRKIEAQLAQNYAVRATFSIPLIPSHPDDEDVKQRVRREEEERARLLREEQMKKELAERIPTWAPAALLQLSETLWKYRHNVEAVVALFDTTSVHARFVTPKSFCKAMRRAGIKAFEGTDGELRSTEFADLFGAWRRAENDIDFNAVIDAMRRHASIDAVSSRLPRQLVDRLYDARETLLKSFESIDIDDRKVVSAHEFKTGVEAITAGTFPEDVISTLVRQFVIAPPASDEAFRTASGLLDDAALVELRVSYVDFFKRLQCSDEPLKESNWIVTRSDLRALCHSA